MLLDLIYTFFTVIILLGFLELTDIYKNYREDIKIMPPKVKTTYHQIILPIENDNSLEEMEMFFRSIHTMNTSGPATQITFEIHSDNSKVSFYLISNINLFSLIRSSLETRYPGVNFVEVIDPFLKFDKNWTKKHNLFQEFRSTDIKYNPCVIDTIEAKADLLPSLSWKTIQQGSNPPTNDPINQIISNFDELNEGEYAVLQIILRATTIDRVKYKKEFEKVRKQLMTNATTDGGNALTEEEKKILNEIQRKITSVNFGMKMRIGYFRQNNEIVTKIPWYLIVKSFLKQFDTPYQSFGVFSPYDYTGLASMPTLHYLNYFESKKKSTEFLEKSYSVMKDDKEGPFIDMQDEEKNIEPYYRKKQQYVALMDRAYKYGAPADNIDVESLTCLFHFPTTNEKSSIISKLQNLAQSGAGESSASWATPPANLPF